MCVLLVEDNGLMRKVVADHLRMHRMAVMDVPNADDALSVLDSPPIPFSALVTDFHVPGEHHGCDVAAEKHSRHPGVPVIVATGRVDVLSGSCKAAAPYAVLEKPYTREELLAAVEAQARR